MVFSENKLYVLAREKYSDEPYQFVAYNNAPRVLMSPESLRLDETVALEAKTHLEKRGYDVKFVEFEAGWEKVINLTHIVLYEEILPLMVDTLQKKS